MVIWVTGLSGAGKSTLCRELYSLLKPLRPEMVYLDGDEVRAAFGGDLGYAERDRVTQVKRLQSVAKLLSDQGLIVLVAVVYAHPDLLEWNRLNFKAYFEVYLQSSLETVMRRDPKGLYGKVRQGESLHMVGIDIPWCPPAAPDLVVDMDNPDPPGVLARRVGEAIPGLIPADGYLRA